jgi:hypothetical protein
MDRVSLRNAAPGNAHRWIDTQYPVFRIYYRQYQWGFCGAECRRMDDSRVAGRFSPAGHSYQRAGLNNGNVLTLSSEMLEIADFPGSEDDPDAASETARVFGCPSKLAQQISPAN